MTLRWCPRDRQMVPWVRATVGRSVKLCSECGCFTAKGKPKPPKHRAADQKWSRAVRERDGHKCRRCGEFASDGAHVIRREFLKTRHDAANGLAFCRKCHSYFGAHPVEWRAWLKANMPDLYRDLSQQAGAPQR